MQKIKNALSKINYINVIGTVILISIILLILILFFFYSANYIAHFTIAAMLPTVISNNDNDALIVNKYPPQSLLKEEMIEENFKNKLFRLNIKKHLKNKDAKNFILVNKNKKSGVIYF